MPTETTTMVDADTLHRLADLMTEHDGLTIHVMCDREGVRLIADHLGKQKVTVTSLSRRLTDALSRIKGGA